MQSLVITYQKVANEWRQLPQKTSELKVEQRSREMLVMWIAFCLVHKRCVSQVPLCAEYNIALDWKDLRVAVLRDRAAISALQRVAKYIRSWNEETKGLPLFDLTNQSATFGFARKFGLNSASIVDTYDREVNIWEAHVKSKWNEIAQKKTRATELRAQISRLDENLESKQNELAEEKRLKTVLKKVLVTPSPLTRPLPPVKDDAIQVIFMVTMPRNLEILGSLCLIAQRAIAPFDPTTEMRALPSVSSCSWWQFYCQHAPSQAVRATTKEFAVMPSSFHLSDRRGPKTIDGLTNIAQLKAECVIDPMLRGTALTWNDPTGVTLNPFNATSKSVTDSFIEQMPQLFEDFQWMNAWPGDDDTRGNMVYANLHKRPEEFEKSLFIALGSMRSYPFQQFRKLQCVLLDDKLPWSHSCVEIIVRQTLYQIGELTAEEDPEMLWKTDMLQGENGLQTFCAVLKLAATRLEQTPRCFENIPLISELSGYLYQFTRDAKSIVELFARMARRWATNLRLEDRGERLPDRVAVLRQKECILYGYALLSYTLGPLDDQAAQEICELMVLFRTSFLCASINCPSTNEMLQVESKLHELMSRKIDSLITYVNRDTDKVLTSLVHLVSPMAPGNLTWKQVEEVPPGDQQLGCCFESSDSHYAVNLFTGVVLTDGNAPGGLPANIRVHERFQSLFGRCNFEVNTVNGLFQTESLYCGRLYEFGYHESEELFVQELIVDSRNISGRFQLCSTGWVASFCNHFPRRLRDLYSHWYWVERDCVLFRPKEAKNREVFFVASFDEHNSLRCYQVPFSDTKLTYEYIVTHLKDYDCLVQKDDPIGEVLRVLTKLEDERFLHPLKSPKDTLKIDLPRFKLQFVLDTDMRFASVEHKGYFLASSQQFDDFLPRFSRYLVLELSDKADITRPEVRILLPVGSVVETSDGMVDISLPFEPDSRVDTVCYDVHRRLRTFETETISARLQLAAVCIRAGTNVPSKRLQMTGAEAALQYLRACRSSRPYSTFEEDTLRTIREWSFRLPAVKILAVTLMMKAEQLGFLYGRPASRKMAMDSVDEQTEYTDIGAGRRPVNALRTTFRTQEEKMIFGLLSLSLTNATTDAMGTAMLDELELSWKYYRSQTQMQLKASPSSLLGSFMEFLDDISSCRSKMETYLWGAFANSTSGKRDQLLALVNAVLVMTVSDIVRCSYDKEMLYKLTLRMNDDAREKFKKGVLQFLEICVLEDKVKRLVCKAKRSADMSDAQLVDELFNVRQWQSVDFPYWLAFEVEGRLQIRHEQFVVAQHLINQPGTVCQLNMGRGKTRVILPMLFLYFTQSRCSRVVRAHFLGPLLSEARHFMHRYLSASSVHLGIFEQPFHRQIELNSRSLELMRDILDEMKLFGGIQIVSPAHRMSLELKRLELDKDASLVSTLDEILDNDQFVDVLDECDALLHHKYHLVYAVGSPIPLRSGMERWKAAEALLSIIRDGSIGSRVAKVLKAPHVSCVAPDYLTRLGAYDGTRLNTVVQSTEELRDHLKKALVLDLIDNAPFELMWLSTLGTGNVGHALVRAITDSSISLHEAMGNHMHKFTAYTSQLLALRGLVAFGVLEHCVEKRYRVDFGLPDPGTRSKKIAIPFRAADVPSERSEFCHPDVCIVLTLLGYYHRGLTNEETRRTFQMLLRLDTSEQRQQYSQWFSSVKSGLDDETRNALGDVRHISLADTRQFESLCNAYKFCIDAINFYLNTCVFPRDTTQYPQRLSRTAWNLAAGANNIGFSGTNDNHRLLPLSVAQCEPHEPSLLGTNGKMIDKMLRVTQGYEVIRPSPRRNSVPWESALLFAMDKKTQALIDTGALLAGVSNHEAAAFLLQQSTFGFAGVTYYDSRKPYNCWMIAEKSRRVVMPLKKASMLESETFVIFDEARSRGSDMKLPSNASAVLTLGPKLTKDKLMQGAGRMRQLGCNQTLWIASFDEVAQSLLQSSKEREITHLTAIDVLNWVMDNTKAESVRGLLEWASNGIHFQKTQLNHETELVNEDWSLKTLYQEKITEDKIARVIEAKARFGVEGVDDALIAEICRRGCVYGMDDEVCITAHTDECERELHVEEEEEHEQEREVAVSRPRKEKTWNYSSILGARSIENLYGIVDVMSMDSFIRQWLTPTNLADLAWTRSKLFGTENFFTTIVARKGMDHLNEFLRLIDVMLIFENGQVLLVSECEADHILGLLWANNCNCSFRLVNFAFVCEAIDRIGAQAQFRDVAMARGSHLDADVPHLSIAACHVFNGETMPTSRQQAALELAFSDFLELVVQREATMANFVTSRGNGHKWPRSFLHDLCCRLDLKTASEV
ncbi:uncharacterized protein PITG_01010 [Phytophthora infestans T30-4]|uniref:ubiquitinyl hydrolase 1 n=1 Tax=Phytophthora infestans (strain T30-4) TaxID=403677 RepID=D0MS85_PHYIT|nr:uncharacterized protein PITG_01010 [Phytophthora infestans T30-4]EEY58354.1 conserved hypothetical protein [Phytophthora infestans T30-4]|eukprot:XP_002909540.1 conserved hypothetical protein [Phytophthora infestans T30-4]